MCLDASLGLDVDQIGACQDFVAAFVPLAYPELFDDFENNQDAHELCNNFFDRVCATHTRTPNKNPLLNKF